MSDEFLTEGGEKVLKSTGDLAEAYLISEFPLSVRSVFSSLPLPSLGKLFSHLFHTYSRNYLTTDNCLQRAKVRNCCWSELRRKVIVIGSMGHINLGHYEN